MKETINELNLNEDFIYNQPGIRLNWVSIYVIPILLFWIDNEKFVNIFINLRQKQIDNAIKSNDNQIESLVIYDEQKIDEIVNENVSIIKYKQYQNESDEIYNLSVELLNKNEVNINLINSYLNINLNLDCITPVYKSETKNLLLINTDKKFLIDIFSNVNFINLNLFLLQLL
jgi:hypothetical protein